MSSKTDKRYIVEEEDEDSYKDLSSGDEEEYHQESPEDLLASVTTVVKVDTISKSPARGGYAQMYKNSKKSNENLKQPTQPVSKNNSSSTKTNNPRICLVNDSLVSLSAIKKTNMNSFPQRYQDDLTCSYSISESAIPGPQNHTEETEEEMEEEDEYEKEDETGHQDEEEEEDEEDEEEQEEVDYHQEEEFEELPDEEDQYEQDEDEYQEHELKSTNLVRNTGRSSIARSSVEEMRNSTLRQNSVVDETEEVESEIEELGHVDEEQLDEEIDEAVMPPRNSMSKSLLKQSLSEKIILEDSSLANTIKTEIDEMDDEDLDEEGDEYKDLEELDSETQEQGNVMFEPIVGNKTEIHENVYTTHEEAFPIIVTNQSHEEKKDMKDNILQSISLFKQYKANQVSQSVVGLDQSRKLRAPSDQPLRVSKVLDMPKPNINLNESISENDVDKIKKQNHLLRMQLLEQQRLIEEGKVTLQERIEQEIEKAKSQALKEFISSKKQVSEESSKKQPEPKVDKKTLRDVKKFELTEKGSVETIRVKENPTILAPSKQKKEVIEILPDEFENTTDMKKQMELRKNKYLEVRKQKLEKIEESKKKEKPQPTTTEAKTAENGMILKNMKQQNKTNKLLIKNALIHLTLAGEVNKKEREDVFEAMKEYEDVCQMIILVREVNVPAFRALYAIVTDIVNANVGSSTSTTDSHRTDSSSRSESPSDKRSDQVLVKKIIGKGPKFLTEDVVDVFCRYDSGGKKLSKLASRTFGVTTDVVVLKSAKKIKR